MIAQDQLQALAELITKHQQAELRASHLDCEANLANAIARIKPGRKYTKIDVGHSGKYMIENETGRIYGIKAYGQVHLGHQYGTLDTINEWQWGRYYAGKLKSVAI